MIYWAWATTAIRLLILLAGGTFGLASASCGNDGFTVLSGVDGGGAANSSGGASGTGAKGGPAGKLVLEIGAPPGSSQNDLLDVAGKATLGGALLLDFANGYVPKQGDKFIVVRASSGVVGSFATITTNGVTVLPGQDATTFFVTVQ